MIHQRLSIRRDWCRGILMKSHDVVISLIYQSLYSKEKQWEVKMSLPCTSKFVLWQQILCGGSCFKLDVSLSNRQWIYGIENAFSFIIYNWESSVQHQIPQWPRWLHFLSVMSCKHGISYLSSLWYWEWGKYCNRDHRIL